MGVRLGFVSTRFSGIDGVSLEASKWAQVLEKSGHQCFWFAGELDRQSDCSFLVPSAHFKDAQNEWINENVFGKRGRDPIVTDCIHLFRSKLKQKLYQFIQKFKIEVIIAENTLSIPMHVPLGLSLSEIVAETQLPTIAHHHDFYWERLRFSVNGINDYIRTAFPPSLPNIKHVVINSCAQEDLAFRTGIASKVVPNVLDFEHPPEVSEQRSRKFRASIGIGKNDYMILQPTRIVRRKGIEYAIELVKELADPRFKLVISHEAGDEGFEYNNWLVQYAKERKVDLRFVTMRIADAIIKDPVHNDSYTLWDVYHSADFITYPSLAEGFGNAFLEAIYLKKPMLINRYATFVKDIEPKGFDLIIMDGILTKAEVLKVRETLVSDQRRRQMVDHNYNIAARCYSYSVLRKHLNEILGSFCGDAVHNCHGCRSDRPSAIQENFMMDSGSGMPGRVHAHASGWP